MQLDLNHFPYRVSMYDGGYRFFSTYESALDTPGLAIFRIDNGEWRPLISAAILPSDLQEMSED